MTAGEAKSLTEKILSYAKVKELQVNLGVTRRGFMRFARNSATTSGATDSSRHLRDGLARQTQGQRLGINGTLRPGAWMKRPSRNWLRTQSNWRRFLRKTVSISRS